MIEQCRKCALYNSLGCPYDYESASKYPDCDEFRPNEESKITDPIKRQLFRLLKDSPSLSVIYEEQWTESVEYLVSNGVTIKRTTPPKKKYRINNIGCDDETVGEFEFNESQYNFLNKVFEKLNANSKYSCMPRIYIEEVVEE